MKRDPSSRKNGEADSAARVAEELDARLAPLLEERGFDLVELTYRRERRGWVLRVTVDKVGGGFTVDDAVGLSRELGALIDADPRLDALLVGPYHLEVSSPGIFRELKRPRDFERAWGKRVRVRYVDATGRPLEVRGRVRAYGDGALVLATDDGELMIDEPTLVQVRLDPELKFGKS